MFAGKAAQALQNRGAQRGIHHRYRLVGHDQLGLEQQRTCYVDALALTTGKLVREATQNVFRTQTDRIERLFHLLACFQFGLGQLEFLDRHVQQVINRIKWVEYCKRILENRLDFLAKFHTRIAGQCGNILAFVENVAFAWLNKAEQQHGQRSLAAAAFTRHGHDGGLIIF